MGYNEAKKFQKGLKLQLQDYHFCINQNLANILLTPIFTIKQTGVVTHSDFFLQKYWLDWCN